jgi:hypothetical protein
MYFSEDLLSRPLEAGPAKIRILLFSLMGGSREGTMTVPKLSE